jgi:hypothetical protein
MSAFDSRMVHCCTSLRSATGGAGPAGDAGVAWATCGAGVTYGVSPLIRRCNVERGIPVCRAISRWERPASRKARSWSSVRAGVMTRDDTGRGDRWSTAPDVRPHSTVTTTPHDSAQNGPFVPSSPKRGA